MNLSKLLITLFTLQAFFLLSSSTRAAPSNSDLFREYIGAEFNGVKFSDVPINPNVDFHFILSFAIDYTTSSSPSPTNGKFNVFWDTDNLSPSKVSSIKSQHSKVKVAVSLGGDSVGDGSAYFNPSSIDSWVSNAISSLTNIIQEYNLDGIDIDYEHFSSDPETFAECIGQLITTLKNNGIISFASIAPFDDDQVQSHYLALWKSYGHLIDYVNFQFYAYDAGTSVDQFMGYFETQTKNYEGGKVLASFSTDGSGGLKPENGFFTACNRLKSKNELHGIFVCLGGDSVGDGSAYFKPSSTDSWISNTVSSLTNIVQGYNLDGTDINYEQFSADPKTFAECNGRLITTLKNNAVISFASIAPFDDDQVQSHYLPLWKSYGHLIDYLNFQFYAYDAGMSVDQFIGYFETQTKNYEGGKVLASFSTDGSGGLSPGKGFFTACNRLKSRNELHGIFVWSADDSKARGIPYEKQSQALLAIHH
ncbi:hypothetical protein LguiA_021072 [Lonicera macranthoides]